MYCILKNKRFKQRLGDSEDLMSCGNIAPFKFQIVPNSKRQFYNTDSCLFCIYSGDNLVDSPDTFGMSPLMIASQKGYTR